MARRQQQRRRFQPPRGARKLDERAVDAALESSARRLLEAHDARSIEGLVADLTQLHAEADLAASEQPSPQALAAFRRARQELSVAQRALQIVERATEVESN